MKTVSLCLITMLVLNTYSLAYPEEPLPTTPAAVASSPQQAKRVKVAIQKCGTGEKSRVKIRLRDKTERRGYISQWQNAPNFDLDARLGDLMLPEYAGLLSNIRKGANRRLLFSRMTILYVIKQACRTCGGSSPFGLP
jgi:hypothetical protein